MQSVEEGTLKIIGNRLKKDPKLKIPVFQYRDAAEYIDDNHVLITVNCKQLFRTNSYFIISELSTFSS